MEATAVDPWHDYLAFPIAPLLLLAQFLTLFASDRRVRLGVAIGVTITLFAMFWYVASLELEPSEGANIGAGVLLLAVLLSLALLPFAGIQEVVNAVRRRRARH